MSPLDRTGTPAGNTLEGVEVHGAGHEGSIGELLPRSVQTRWAPPGQVLGVNRQAVR